jgi:hypothetical protein|nr:MAG TPA: hypothetical protein [Caudoviricetes sp.]
MDWVISSQAPNRGRFNDYPVREYTASDWRWKWLVSLLKDKDIVYSLVKARGVLYPIIK